MYSSVLSSRSNNYNIDELTMTPKQVAKWRHLVQYRAGVDNLEEFMERHMPILDGKSPLEMINEGKEQEAFNKLSALLGGW